MARPAPHSREKELLSCHEDHIRALSDMVSGGNIPHAFLFSGQKGIGKSTVAYHFAKMILSIGKKEIKDSKAGPITEEDLFGSVNNATEKNPEGGFINDNVSEKVSNRAHMDLYIMENNKEDLKSISIEEVRNIAKFLSLTPAESKYRVAIIDSIDDFSLGASNAILKILEEPTRNTILILISHSKINLLPTTISRCVEIKFHPLLKRDFIVVLSDLGYSEERLEDVYTLSRGSPGLAFEILEKGANTLLERYNLIIENKVINISEVISLAKEIKEKDSWGVFSNLLLNYYSKVIRSRGASKRALDNFNKISEIVYFSTFRNMDVQDSLKYITFYINQNR